jgi:DnaK suppressor protein
MDNLVVPFSELVLGRFRDKLRAERREVRQRIERNLREARTMAEGDPGDYADRAVASEQAHRLYRAADRDRTLVLEIDHALERIERGDFGLCEGSGDPIEPGRLEARPWARYSRAHLEELRRR